MGKSNPVNGSLDSSIIDLIKMKNTTYFSIANKLMREGKLEEAIACYRRAIAQNPNFAWSHHNLAEALIKQGQIDEAIASYRRAIEINPNFASFHHNLREALVKPRIMANTDEGMVDIFTTVSRDNSSEKLVAQALEKPKSSKNYVICFTERSGSSMLCSILKQTNLLGMPNEYVNPRGPMQLYLKTCPATTLEEYFELLRRTQTTPNGIFGLKSCFFDFKPLIEMGGVGKLLNPVQFIYLTRRDIILQAISGYLARKSGIWHISSQAGGAENLDYSKVEYDEEQILKLIDIQIKDRLEWERFFTLYSIEPLRIVYEDIVESPITCVKQILSFLGENTDISTEDIKSKTVKTGGEIAQNYARRLRESFTL
ncbi:Stf0 family sulfotransferase [Planktothricoides raciborskii]|uniref:Stf0 family sulfotransferase n=1 Tax=Planktothricoides raciborskii GIHE-MW2 TaxID=2792601 RepID=A0AAU8JCB5_9CYAN